MKKDLKNVDIIENNTDNWIISDIEIKNKSLLKKPESLVKKMYNNARRSNVKPKIETKNEDHEDYKNKRFKKKFKK
jgi:hypothetical protein